MDGLWDRKSEGVGLIVSAVSFQDFHPMCSRSTNVTDRRTDGQTDGQTDDMQSQYRALHYSASRGKYDLTYPVFLHQLSHCMIKVQLFNVFAILAIRARSRALQRLGLGLV